MRTRPRLLLMGASSRIGRSVRKCWDSLTEPVCDVVYQYRTQFGVEDLCWDPMHGVDPLLQHIETHGKFSAMVVLSGAIVVNEDTLEHNSLIAEACLSAAHAAQIPKVLLASSSSVYGAWQTDAFSESDSLKPVSLYGLSKVKMERVCESWANLGLETCCLRIGNVAGADALLSKWQHCDIINPLLIDRFPNGRGPKRSYIGPTLLADAIISLALNKKRLPSIINLASSPPVFMETLAEIANLPWTWKEASTNSNQYITLDLRLLGSIFYQPQSNLNDLIADWISTRN
jgi:UDP-glucose 4-epimerase